MLNMSSIELIANLILGIEGEINGWSGAALEVKRATLNARKR